MKEPIDSVPKRLYYVSKQEDGTWGVFETGIEPYNRVASSSSFKMAMAICNALHEPPATPEERAEIQEYKL